MKHILFVMIVCGLTSCLFQEPCKKHYAFEFPVTVTPQDTFVMGDTIWWEIDIPNQLMDHNSGDYIDITDFELFFSFGISKLDSSEPITGNGHIHLFRPVEDKGAVKEVQNGLSHTYFLTESIQRKQFRLGYIPMQQGTYASEVGFPSLYINKDLDLDDQLHISDLNCEETIVFYSKIIANNKDINYSFAEGLCRFTLSGERRCYGPEKEIPNYGFYAFHVKEP